MRGLKLANRLNQLVVYNVASFTDAWIETEKKEEKNIGNDSRIFYRCVDWNNFLTFPPAITKVASFTDAWIETKI